MDDGDPWLRSSSAARVQDRKPLCVPLIGGFETTIEIKCLIAAAPGSSSQSQEQQQALGLICLGAAGVNGVAAGSGEVLVWSRAAFLASTGAQFPHTPKEEIAKELLGSGCSSSKGLVET